MGISRGAIKLAGMALKNKNHGGSVITFGVQGIQATYEQAQQLLQESGITTRALKAEEIRSDGLTQYGATIHQDSLFRMMGFDHVESIDFYPDEQPTHVLDLNHPLPSQLYEKYDLVYDGGTSEHCFATSESLSNAMRLVRPGGRVIHHLPMNNWVDHGFFQFSPTIFFDFYEANGFDEIRMALHFTSGKREKYLEYDPLVDGRLPYALGRGTKILAHFSARRAKPLGEIVFPIQGRYRSTFGGELNAKFKENRRTPWARLQQSLRKRTFMLRATPL